MKKVKELMRKIFITVLLLTICQSSLFYLGTAMAATATETGKKAKMTIATYPGDIDGFYTFKKNGIRSLDIYCAQHGGKIGRNYGVEHYEVIWNSDAGIWAGTNTEENAYEKITWIKNNFWEKNSASSSNKYDTNQKLKFLQQADSTITIDDVKNVFDNTNEKFKLYQLITWKYTNGKPSTYKLAESTKKVYDAIIALANANYKNYDAEQYINLTSNEDPIYSDIDGTYTWSVIEDSLCFYPIEYVLTVNGNKHENYTYKDNKLTIQGLEEGKYSFEFSATSMQVSSTASIWKNTEKQDLIEITDTKKKTLPGTVTGTSEEPIKGYFSLNIKKVDETGVEGIPNAEFSVEEKDPILLTDDEGITIVEDLKEITEENVTYTYTITEESVAEQYIKLDEPIKIKLKSGTRTINDKIVYGINQATFEKSGTSVLEVKLSNGSIVTLSLELIPTNDTTMVTLTIPNKEKIYDLALTKTIIIPNRDLIEKFDMNFDGNLTIDDYRVIQNFTVENFTAENYKKYYDKSIENGTYYIEDTEVEEAIKLIGMESDNDKHYAKAILGFFRYEIIDEGVRENYSYLDSTYIIEKFMNLDNDNNKRVDLIEAYNLLTTYAAIASSMSLDRINSIDTQYLNTTEGNKTATYNLNKSTYRVKKSDIVKYKITVYNEGNYNAKDIQVTDYLPDGLYVCDDDGNKVEQGTVTFKDGSKEYVWTVDGKTATTTISDTINAYTGETLDYYDVYIKCKIEDSADIGDILYNVAEISSSTPVDDNGDELTYEVTDGDSDSDSDRDSTENSLSAEDALIEEYKGKFEPNEDNSNAVNKDEYNYQDDDDFERIVIVEDSQFDLALRKSITKIGKSESTMETYTKDTEDRLADITEQSVNTCIENGTGEYYHGKEAIVIESDDFIEYTIRIYNEGSSEDFSGYAKQITDYLPAGLKFHAIVDSDGETWITEPSDEKYATTKNNFGSYEAAYDETNNKLVINCIDTPALDPKNNLATIRSIDESKIQSYYNDIGTLNSIAYCYQEVKIICTVSEDARANTNLTNIAEITSSIAINNGAENEEIKDEDSVAKSIGMGEETKFISNQEQIVNLDTYYDNRSVDDTYSSYYSGLQDDDDFETVKIEILPGAFDLELIKYVSGTTIPLSGAKFSVEIKNNDTVVYSEDNLETGNDGKLTTEITGIEVPAEGIEYTISITETSVPVGYTGIDGTITFTAKSRLSENGRNYELVPTTSKTIANAKEVTVTADKISIIAENTPEGPHKGVKEVYNQNSGYNGDETQEWVIQQLIPSGIDKYGKYIITDTIDERLVFSGIDSVKVKILNENDLVKDTDYKVDYDETSRTLKVSFIEGNFIAGQSLTPGDILEIRFNTTFALDENGNIIALNQSVPNQAELTYGNSNGEEVSLKTEIPEVHTGGVGVYKYDEETGIALEGAKFKIATSKENAEKGIFVKDASGNDLVAVSNNQGIAMFTGLEFGEDAMDNDKYKTEDNIYGNSVYTYNWEEVETKYYIVEVESPEGFNKIEETIEVTVKKDSSEVTDIEDLVKISNKKSIYDLALRKFITEVDGTKLEGESSREPDVDLANLIDGTSTTATYIHTKDPELVANGQIVTYTLRVYNEGPKDAYASLIKDDIPDGLEFITYTEGDGSINDVYGWKLVDENDNEVTDISKAKYIVTDYLAKDENELNLISGFNKDTMSELDYRDVQVQFKVTEPNTSDRVITNYAQISKQTNSEGTPVTDRDSTPNEWKNEDDEDTEQVKVLYFDLELRKWVTQAIVTENGQTTITETGHKAEDNPENVVKVDLKKSKLNDVTVKFKYSIRITNKGKIAGEAQEISDYIPAGLKFVQEDNPDWKEVDGKVTTDRLKGVILEPEESTEVEIVLTWINSEDNMGEMVNTAEISKDYNKYGTPDIDSTPNNKKPKEDDIDTAPVMISIKTGSEIIMIISLALGVIAIIGVGVTLIKKYV